MKYETTYNQIEYYKKKKFERDNSYLVNENVEYLWENYNYVKERTTEKNKQKVKKKSQFLPSFILTWW